MASPAKKGAAKAAPTTTTVDPKLIKTGTYFKDANGKYYRVGQRDFWSGGFNLFLVKGGTSSSDECLAGGWRPGSDRTKSRPKPWTIVDSKEARANAKQAMKDAKRIAAERKAAEQAKKEAAAKAKIDAKVQSVMDLIAEMGYA